MRTETKNRCKRGFAGFALLLSSAAFSAQQPLSPDYSKAPTHAASNTIIAIKAGTLLTTGKDGHLGAQHDQWIIVRGNKIVEVRSGGAAPAGAEVIDLGAETVLPGLIDTHTHLFLQGEDPALGGYDVQLLKYSISYRTARATVSARRALEQGFTTIRDLETEGAGYGDMGIKQAVNEGWIPGPRIFGVTRAISTTGGYNLEGYAPEIEVPKGAQLIDGPIEARKAAREQLDHGADWIKVYMTHRSWVDENGELRSQPTLTLDEIRAVVDETHGWGKRVACHVYNGIGLQRALDGGCDSIEHGLELTDANIAQMLKQGTWYVPTLTVYYYWWGDEGTPERARDVKRVTLHQASFEKALKAGVKIAFGTDVGGFPWTDSIAKEFEYETQFGMSPAQAIESATSKAAALLEMDGKIGVVAPGAFADIVAVTGDPLKDVKLLQHVDFVMKDGKVFADKHAPCDASSPESNSR